jgi:hypothetical protein
VCVEDISLSKIYMSNTSLIYKVFFDIEQFTFFPIFYKIYAKCFRCKDFKMFKNEIGINESVIKQITLLVRICAMELLEVQS